VSWLELDDRILEHPKFIRAIKLGGSEAVHLWLGLRAYCGQNLTDGFIPEDMLDEVRGPSDPRKRAKALASLRTVGLLDEAPGGVMMHDFLEWSSSREEVLQRRESAKNRKRRSRANHSETDREQPPSSRRDSAVTDAGVRSESPTPARADPLPLPSPPLLIPPFGRESAPAPPSPAGSVAKPKREPKPRAASLPDDWRPKPEHADLARKLGVNARTEFDAFRDHAQATGRVMVDWDACFRTWLRRAQAMRPAAAPGRPMQPPGLADHRRHGGRGDEAAGARPEREEWRPQATGAVAPTEALTFIGNALSAIGGNRV
jgi:hypothetical protein